METGFFYDNGLMFGPPFWMYYVADIIIFIVLFLLSLPHYNWKKKMQEVEAVTDIVAKDDTHND
jgi:uncharacterized membrane protein